LDVRGDRVGCTAKRPPAEIDCEAVWAAGSGDLDNARVINRGGATRCTVHVDRGTTAPDHHRISVQADTGNAGVIGTTHACTCPHAGRGKYQRRGGQGHERRATPEALSARIALMGRLCHDVASWNVMQSAHASPALATPVAC
jgi:hypothetical protein